MSHCTCCGRTTDDYHCDVCKYDVCLMCNNRMNDCICEPTKESLIRKLTIPEKKIIP